LIRKSFLILDQKEISKGYKQFKLYQKEIYSKEKIQRKMKHLTIDQTYKPAASK
jgi:hypothetical protein